MCFYLQDITDEESEGSLKDFIDDDDDEDKSSNSSSASSSGSDSGSVASVEKKTTRTRITRSKAALGRCMCNF